MSFHLPLEVKPKLSSSYYDNVLEKPADYCASGVYGGFGMMCGTGVITGLLGIGKGIFKVMAMDLFMKLPLKVSSTKSNFLIGVTAAASADVYLLRGISIRQFPRLWLSAS